MMRRLREIPCRMLARTAVQPRVLVALIIQCATMGTEVVEGDNFDESSDEEVEEDSTLLQGEIRSSAHSEYVQEPGADPGEVKWVNFHLPPFFRAPFFLFFFVIPQILK